jgi:chemotaxis protein MotB
MYGVWVRGALICLGLPLVLGCSSGRKLVVCQEEITSLRGQLEDLHGELASERARAEELNAELEAALRESHEREQILLEQAEERARVTIPEAVLFASGSAKLSDQGRRILGGIGDVLARHPDREIRIEGHTDSVPIAARYQDKYKSNWELSSARAHAVLHYLRKAHAVDPRRLAAVGCGEYRPVGDNRAEAGRSLNRRVIIVIGSRLAALSNELAAADE